MGCVIKLLSNSRTLGLHTLTHIALRHRTLTCAPTQTHTLHKPLFLRLTPLTHHSHTHKNTQKTVAGCTAES